MTRRSRRDSSQAVGYTFILTIVPTAHKNTRHRGRSTFTTIRRTHGRTFGNELDRDRPERRSSDRLVPHTSTDRSRLFDDDDVCPSARVYPRGDADRDRTSRRERHDARERRAPELVPRLRRPRVLGWIVAVVRAWWWCRMGKQCVLGRISRYGHGSRIIDGETRNTREWMNE